ncbi:hypothetical protein [Micromonospora sp. NPDC006431]|uniref:hypothetical protein n=1 Tax=Micromonospora sp. NPDC006431 TaxID=3364235 RepID=UPI0036CE63AC
MTSSTTSHAPFLLHHLADELRPPLLDPAAEHSRRHFGHHTTWKTHWKTTLRFDRSATDTREIYGILLSTVRAKWIRYPHD